MAGLIPEDKITAIKNTADIVSVIGESVTLKRAGQNYVGLCPFHNEKTGSFSVNPARQMFYCFGCGVGGNVIKFMMLKDGLTFPEAARNLARRFGITLDFDARTQEILSRRDRLFKANQLAQEFYVHNLRQEPGKQGLTYLGQRGVTDETIRKFGLGLSSDAWDGLFTHLRKNGVTQEEALKAGLIIPRKSGSGYFDRFRNRLMFPIYDESSRIVGFGGRVLSSGEPKYLNSPETELYSKSRSLYGLHASKTACLQEGEVYIVEGYMDAIMLYQHGVPNVAATLGTAMTTEHVRLLKRYAKKRITLVYDSDAAGIRSARRCADIFLKEHADFSKNDVFTEENADTHILILPQDHDPDSYVREYGAEAFRAMARKAYGIVPFMLEEAVKKHGESVEGKVRVVHELMPVLAVVNDKIAQSLYVRQIAEYLKENEELVWKELKAAYVRQKGKVDLEAPEQFISDSGYDTSTPVSRYEKKIAGLCLQYPEYIDEMLITGLKAEHFKTKALHDLMQALWNYAERNEVQRFIEELENEVLRKLAYNLCMSSETCELDAALALTRAFVEQQAKTHARAKLAKIREAAVNNDEELLQKLLMEKQQAARTAQKNKRSLQRKPNTNASGT